MNQIIILISVWYSAGLFSDAFFDNETYKLMRKVRQIIYTKIHLMNPDTNE